MAEFIDQYTEWKGDPPESNTFEAIGRDNIYAYVQAAENAGSTEPDALLAGAGAEGRAAAHRLDDDGPGDSPADEADHADSDAGDRVHAPRGGHPELHRTGR